jgi:hypothetical protein
LVAVLVSQSESEDSTDPLAGDTSTRAHAFESSDLGQALISSLIALILIIGVAWNLPDSKIKQSLVPLLEPVAQAVGLEQVWQMYAPNVIREQEYTDIQVTMADGTVRTWQPPSGDKVIGPFVWYHWQKLKENLPRDLNMRADTAHWVVRKLTDPGEKPVRVRIILRATPIAPPGQRAPQDMREETLYDETLVGRP